MTWFRVDDTLTFHPKVHAAGLSAIGLWVLAGSWSMHQGTDGLVPTHMLRVLGGKKAHADSLVKVGLWEKTDEGYRFHDWLSYQPTAAEVIADKNAKAVKKAEAGRLGGIASGIARRKQTGSKDEANTEAEPNENEAPTQPNPTQQKTSSSEARKRATAVPDIFPITEAMRAWGRQHAPAVKDPEAETRQFLDHHRAKGSTFKDWTAAWRTWMGNAQKYAARSGAPARPLLSPADAWLENM